MYEPSTSGLIRIVGPARATGIKRGNQVATEIFIVLVTL